MDATAPQVRAGIAASAANRDPPGVTSIRGPKKANGAHTMTGPAKPDARPITARIRDQLAAGAGSRGATMPTLDEIKDMLGIPPGDTTLDDEITDGMAATIAIVEAYLGRGVVFAAQLQLFEPVDSRNRRLMLFRFPVTEVREVTVDGTPVTGWRLFKASGILQWRDGCYFPHSCAAEPIISVDYSGGYADDAWPPDLMDAILRAFFARWHATGDTGNSADMSIAGTHPHRGRGRVHRHMGGPSGNRCRFGRAAPSRPNC